MRKHGMMGKTGNPELSFCLNSGHLFLKDISLTFINGIHDFKSSSNDKMTGF